MTNYNCETNRTPDFLAVDFYCGAGGTTHGMLNAGGYVIAGVDKDANCKATYQSNNRNRTLDQAKPIFLDKDMFPATPDYREGQQEEIKTQLLNLIPRYQEQAPGKPMLFTICAPCQSFTKFAQPSITNERASRRARDQNLISQALVFIEEFQPEMVLSENVSGIENGKYSYIWNNFKKKLRKMEYRVGSNEICATRFGVAQRRKRSILIAVKAQKPSRRTLALQVPAGDETAPQKTVREVIGNLDQLQAGEKHPTIANHRCRNISNLNRRRLLAISPGENNYNFPEELKLPCHMKLAEKGHKGFGDAYTRINPDQPAPTITTKFHSVSNGRFGHYDPNQARALSLHEGALIQSFPPEYEFIANNTDQIAKMIGNAVPPLLAEYIARNLLSAWAEEHDTPKNRV